MKAFVKVDGVFSGDNIFLSSFLPFPDFSGIFAAELFPESQSSSSYRPLQVKPSTAAAHPKITQLSLAFPRNCCVYTLMLEDSFVISISAPRKRP